MYEISNKLEKEIQNFLPITLEEMDDVKLMKRTDTKFVIHEKDLVSVLKRVEDAYKVVEINGNRISTYSSLYFDTPEHKFYKDHHNGKNNRTKIRIRKYVESNICFLEIKQKDGKGNTTKTRTAMPNFQTNLLEASRAFIKKTTQETFDLEPIIWNQFNRVTLVNKTDKERLTIDLNLSFKKNDLFKTYNNLVIIELKQERFNRNSPIVQELKSKQINPYSISKYCIGMISIYDNLKYNRFKEKLIKINKITA
ncbi:polyphosphate polymerase domain-containing protein [Mariniflexile gromovii]|uniref:Polyphosphate polymerase domain-containing protein n=1 Tax=Mariniflexile gromovii TaxID=362523 RepID=A0ABS4BTD3_9FLAO|nr:polyphosphate polymerase domain-containing protein [Mariniflexile gromovii]MBP0903325.1 polyphosphate polymerase domain-containing protein [Mariniflexile gromovii]